MARSSPSNGLPLTPENLRAAYEYLSLTMPFLKWNMPDSDDVKFEVVPNPKHMGRAILYPHNKYAIQVSTHHIGRTQSLMELMAHEMVHIHQREAGMDSRKTHHNEAFKKLGDLVCKYHGFDPKTF